MYIISNLTGSHLPSSGCSTGAPRMKRCFSLCYSVNISRILKAVQLAAWVKAADLKPRHDAAGGKSSYRIRPVSVGRRSFSGEMNIYDVGKMHTRTNIWSLIISTKTQQTRRHQVLDAGHERSSEPPKLVYLEQHRSPLIFKNMPFVQYCYILWLRVNIDFDLTCTGGGCTVLSMARNIFFNNTFSVISILFDYSGNLVTRCNILSLQCATEKYGLSPLLMGSYQTFSCCVRKKKQEKVEADAEILMMTSTFKGCSIAHLS